MSRMSGTEWTNMKDTYEIALMYERDLDMNNKWSEFKFRRRHDDHAGKRHQATQGQSFIALVAVAENMHSRGVWHHKDWRQYYLEIWSIA